MCLLLSIYIPVMLEYSKIILKKVSFDSILFEKELKKSLSYLVPEETQILLAWAKIHYVKYSYIIENIHHNVFF